MYNFYTSLLLALVILEPLMIVDDTNSTLDPFQWLKNIFDKGIAAIEELGSYFLGRLVKFLLFFSRMIYAVVIIIGLILWLSGLQPHKGRRFVIGSIFLAIIVEFLSIILT